MYGQISLCSTLAGLVLIEEGSYTLLKSPSSPLISFQEVIILQFSMIMFLSFDIHPCHRVSDIFSAAGETPPFLVFSLGSRVKQKHDQVKSELWSNNLTRQNRISIFKLPASIISVFIFLCVLRFSNLQEFVRLVLALKCNETINLQRVSYFFSIFVYVHLHARNAGKDVESL